jgi:SWI/SNF-related matrix-associated actin-dependent regulator of chromatin subfamily A3
MIHILRSPTEEPADEITSEDTNETPTPKLSAKLDTLIKLLGGSLARQEDGKLIVFSQWTKMLDLIEPHLKANDFPFSRLDGSMTRLKRQLVISEFQQGDKIKIMLMSLNAGSLGLTLTAAHQVVLVDPWWNPAVEQQAIDRVYRIGQTKDVKVYRLVVKNSIEERIMVLQEKKRELHRETFSEKEKTQAVQVQNLKVLIGENEADQSKVEA